ncbi:hypothetical protein A4A49_19291 [Nicotiana attenuata]|uniref:Uncharacterized protein n=1 Tax=Nicotiana attenuata TaxID=49451 RepID=A0A1J6IKE4_NICAT|nr:hypothetical protein A4A49_19291 [Nicotiana attenuata]
MASERDELWWSCDGCYGLEMKRVAVFDFSGESGDRKERRWRGSSRGGGVTAVLCFSLCPSCACVCVLVREFNRGGGGRWVW